MQTFFPVAGDAEKSLLYLDERRRLNQINETYVILNTLMSDRTTGWPNHPATLMWEHYEAALASYGLTNVNMFSGYDKQRERFQDIVDRAEGWILWPKWTRDERVASSHRSNLYRKNPAYYPEAPAQGYVWPVWRRVKVGGFLLNIKYGQRHEITRVGKDYLVIAFEGSPTPVRATYEQCRPYYYYEAPL